MDKRKNWTMTWTVSTPRGTVLVEYKDGKAIWISGERVGK